MQEPSQPIPELQDNNLEPQISPEEVRRRKQLVLAVTGITLVVLVILIASVYFLLQPTTDTAKIADVFIIFMALQSLILMLALVILIIQLSILINLLQNEIKPIIDSTNETVSTMRGTASFLSENLTEPVIRLNEYLAGIQQLFSIFGAVRPGKSKKKSNSQGE